MLAAQTSLTLDLGQPNAVFAQDERWRTALWRPLPRFTGHGTRMMALMINPSKAGIEINDPTVRKVIEFATRLGHEGLWVGNLFAWIDTNPRGLLAEPDPTGGWANDVALLWMAADADIIVCAWGNGPGGRFTRVLEARALSVLRLLTAAGHGAKLHRFGALTGQGQPNHPLYLPYSTPVLPIAA